MKNIATALVKAQKEFAPALKTSSNPFFKSKYVQLDACIECVIDALNNNGIFLMQRNHNCESGITVETVFIHESGEEISGGLLHVPAIKNDPQAYGSALTYARRYSLMAACGIAPEDDDGESATRPGSVIVKPSPQMYNQYDQAGFDHTLNNVSFACNMEDLTLSFTSAKPHCNAEQLAQLTEVCRIKKLELTKGS